MNYITYIGLAAAACTTISFLPQVIQVVKTKETKNLSLTMYITFTIGVILWFVYGIMVKDLPLLTANGVTLALASTILVMKIKYK